jgi:hypothetical protein
MANRYQDRPFPAVDDYDRGEDHVSARGENDPLAELAKLIGQTDPFGTMGRANQQLPPRTSARDQYQRPSEPEPDEGPPAGPPPWMQRANRQEIPQQEPPPEYPEAVHPLQRYAAARVEPEPDYHQPQPAFDDDDREPDPSRYDPDPSRYDDALYGQLDVGGHQSQHDPAYADDAYGYQDGYEDGIGDQDEKRRGGMATVIVVLALAVVGTGAAFAYRTYFGSPRISGEPPIIRADSSPTKIVPSPGDGTAKLPDRLAAGDGTEKIVPREEAPVDVNANTGPRVVFPPLNQNGNPPSAASVALSGGALASAGNGTLPNTEPRKIKTLTVRGDQLDGSAAPVTSAPPSAKPAPAARTNAAPSPAAATRSPPSAANASANVPLSLAPGAQPALEPHNRVANNNPAQTAPAGGGYLVQVSSQRNEADAQASYRALQGKFPSVLGSHEPLVKRADLGEKGVYYRAMVGPFGTSEEAAQFCGNLKSAGGQCVVQRN